jgi:hypothetical protein
MGKEYHTAKKHVHFGALRTLAFIKRRGCEKLSPVRIAQPIWRPINGFARWRQFSRKALFVGETAAGHLPAKILRSFRPTALRLSRKRGSLCAWVLIPNQRPRMRGERWKNRERAVSPPCWLAPCIAFSPGAANRLSLRSLAVSPIAPLRRLLELFQ